MKTIVSLLWPDSHGVLVELARSGWLSFVWVAPPEPAVVEQLAALGAAGRMLTVESAQRSVQRADADARSGALERALERAIAPLGRVWMGVHRGSACLRACRAFKRVSQCRI